MARINLLGFIFIVFINVADAADNLVLVTLDGFRWQEVFRGYDAQLLGNEKFTEHPELLLPEIDGVNLTEKREKLLPFLWGTLAEDGVIIGNRDKNSAMAVTNPWWFSYPGYNEILTGKADPEINSNEAKLNKNVTVLEWLNQQKEYRGRVAAFGGWDVFPAIINEQRSGVPVNAGFEAADWPRLSKHAQWLNKLQTQIPSPWHNVRLDAFTYGLAKDYLITHKPNVLYIAFGETDDFAHDENYQQYLTSAQRCDQFIADLWHTIQTTKGYKNNTNLIITVDHGRGGDEKTWPHHASARAVQEYFKDMADLPQGIVGSDAIWLAAVGPDIKKIGEVSDRDIVYQNQIAATVLHLLGLDYHQYDQGIGEPVEFIFNNQ